MEIEYKGYTILIDEIDYEFFKSKNWFVNRHPRNKCYLTCWKDQPFHRAILGLKKGDGKFVDHANGNGLDNRRCNLRLATMSDNNRNIPSNPYRTRMGKPKTSIYKGVYHTKNKTRYAAVITVNNVVKYLGTYSDEKNAARAYNEAAIKYFGEFAAPNII